MVTGIPLSLSMHPHHRTRRSLCVGLPRLLHTVAVLAVGAFSDPAAPEDHADRPIPESTTSYTFGVKITGTGGLLQSVVEESEREMAANDAKRVAVVDDNSDALEAPSPSSGATHTWLLALESGNTQTRRAYLSKRGDKTPQLRDEVAVTGWGATVWHSGVITHVGTGTKRKGLEYTVPNPIYRVLQQRQEVHCLQLAGPARQQIRTWSSGCANVGGNAGVGVLGADQRGWWGGDGPGSRGVSNSARCLKWFKQR